MPVQSNRLQSLARAAMLGLLAAAQTACSDSDAQDPDGAGGSADGPALGSGGQDGPGSSSNAGGASSTGGAPSVGMEGGAGGVGGALLEGVLSSRVIPNLSLAEFTEMCDVAVGVVETHAVCGGVVTGKGFSYDSDTDVFTEHTCRGYNTCRGFSCVLDD